MTVSIPSFLFSSTAGDMQVPGLFSLFFGLQEEEDASDFFSTRATNNRYAAESGVRRAWQRLLENSTTVALPVVRLA